MNILITGANGFIGTHLTQALEQDGHTIWRLLRKPIKETDLEFDMANPASIESTLQKLQAQKIDWLIHLAYTTRYKNAEEARSTNIKGSITLFDACKKQNIPVLFLSSLAAHENALSIYGRSKYFLEGELDAQHDCIIRPGLVITNNAGNNSNDSGVFGRMLHLLKTIKCAPLFWGGQQKLQTVSIEDLIYQLRYAVNNHNTGTYIVATQHAITMQQFYETLFTYLHQRPRFLSLPGNMILKLAQLCEKCGITLPISSENLLGLKAMISHPVSLPDPSKPPASIYQYLTKTMH